MANIILTKELSRIFTEVVNGYLATGMTFHINTMAGHQGEIAKVDLTDGTDVYRINMTSESCFKDDFHGNKVVVTVEKFEGKDESNGFRTFGTIWTGSGEQISEMVWYSVGRDNKAWTESLEYAKECQNKQYYRSRTRGYSWNTEEREIGMDTEEQRNFIRDICRQHRGYGKVKRADMSKLVKFAMSSGRTGYKVYFNNGKNALVIK